MDVRQAALQRRKDKSARKASMSEITEILESVRQNASEALPEGFHVDSVDLSFSDLRGYGKPNFCVEIRVTKEDDRPEPAGWGYEISQRIRRTFLPEDFYIEITMLEP
jgi:hypothetical protein